MPMSAMSEWAFARVEEYALRPGKRLRGALTLQLYQGITPAESDAGIWLAAAIELMHDYLLVIDDVMDRSPLRRGQPTMHELYKAQYGSEKSAFEADMVAINIGLILQHIAAWTAVRAEAVSGQSGSRLMTVMNRYLCVTGLGQLDDITESVRTRVAPEDILAKYYKKSSYYTFVNPLACALALAGRYDEAVQRDVEAFGLPAGAAFQLRDDWLSIFGDSAESGKTNLDDIQEGKNTFLVQSAFAVADDDQAATLRSIIGNPEADSDDLATVRQMLMETGAVGASDEEMHQQAQRAQEAARQATCWSADFADLLCQVVQYSVERTR